MNARFVALLFCTLALAGCLEPTGEGSDGPVVGSQPAPESRFIDWFASSGGAPGNRATFAVNDGILAVDDPDGWTIHILWGADLANETTYEPQAEPLNLAAALGPRGPAIAYRSQVGALFVAEWDGVSWNEGVRTYGPGTLLHFPRMAGTASELLVGVPVLPSPLEEGRYEVLRLSGGVPADLSAAPSIQYPSLADIAYGDVATHGGDVAVTYQVDYTTIAFVEGLWAYLNDGAPKTYKIRDVADGPMGLYTNIARQEDENWIFSASYIPNTFLTAGQRDGFVFDVSSGNRVALQTRDIVQAWTAPQGVVVVYTDQDADYHANYLTPEGLQEFGVSECDRLAVLPNGVAATLDSVGGRMVTELRDLAWGVPQCLREP